MSATPGYINLPDQESMTVREFFDRVTGGDLTGYTLQSDNTVRCPDGSIIDSHGCRTLATGSVLFPGDKSGFVSITDVSGILNAWGYYCDDEIDRTELWRRIDEEVQRQPDLPEEAADLLDSLEQEAPRPA